MSALQPSPRVPAGLGPGALRHAQESTLGWASPFGLMLLTRMGHTAPLPSPLSYSGPSSFSLTHIFFSEKVTAFLIEVPLILYSCQNLGHLPDF